MTEMEPPNLHYCKHTTYGSLNWKGGEVDKKQKPRKICMKERGYFVENDDVMWGTLEVVVGGVVLSIVSSPHS